MNAPATLAAGAPAARRAPTICSRSTSSARSSAFDTTSRDSNLALIDWVRDYLDGHGIASTLTFDDDRRKANLFATLPARDGNATDRRHRAVRPHRRRAGRRPAVGHRSVRRDAARRPPVRPRRHRHEELLGDRARVRAGVPAPRPRAAAALRAVLRRGSRLHRRAPADRRHRRARHRARRLHRRRADRHGARRRAQGQEELALPRARPRGAFVADAARRQRRADRLRDRRVHRAARARLPRRRRPATTPTTCRTRRCTSA